MHVGKGGKVGEGMLCCALLCIALLCSALPCLALLYPCTCTHTNVEGQYPCSATPQGLALA